MMTTTDEPRTIVIGSGPSGAVAAHRLVERGVPVRLLDAGPAMPGGLVVRAMGNTMYRRMDYSRYQADRLANPESDRVTWISSHSHGGMSNYWTSAVPRFAPDDFTDGERLDERYRWPVGYDDLAPHYDRAERHLRVTAGGPIVGLPDNVTTHRHDPPPDWQAVADACAVNGEGLGPIPMAKGDPWMVARRGTEFNSYHCVLADLVGDPRFELRAGARVTQLVWSASEGRVTHVEYLDQATGQQVRTPARSVVVAAGAVDTTMILLRSTSNDFPDGLGNTNGVLGRYLHDHPREWWPAELERPMRALHHPMYLVRRAHDRSDPLLATSHTVGLVRPRERLRTYVRAKVGGIGVQVFGTMVPDPEFRVTIDRSEPDGKPTLRLAYDAAAIRTVVESRDRFRDVLSAAGLGIRLTGPYHDMLPGESVHLAGTARMHDDPEFGVIDRWSRIHDAPDVIVADMAAFTTSPEKNPTLTAMALAIRAADRLADDLTGAATGSADDRAADGPGTGPAGSSPT